MIKCFLSHSSHDKKGYVREVARRMKKEVKVFDEETFEQGMSPIEEIIKGLDESSLFVIFISEHALETPWVKLELEKAKNLLDEAKLARIYPIIIDSNITYADARIPEWMRADLNIQPILKPSVAARRINTRLTELSWAFHPRLKERQQIFVGRNEQIKEIEERLDDFSKKTPIVLISSGLPSIGRKSLLQHALRKSNLVRDSYECPIVSLSPLDGIEDFILKICDLGFFSDGDILGRLNGSFAEKLELAKEVASQIVFEKERVLIEDRGVLFQGNGEVVDWFEDVVQSIATTEHLTFVVASQFRPKASLNRLNPMFYFIPLGEMTPAERNGLLSRYAKFEGLEISKLEYSFFSDLLTGYPEQVLYAVHQIRDFGLFKAKKESHLIQQYGADKAKVVMDEFTNEETVLNFIYLLCKFEFISYEVLFDIADESIYFPILERLISSSVCERMGAAAEYLRVNEVIRDYVSRSRFGTLTGFESQIKEHISSFLERYEDDNYDISDYIFSAQESLRQGSGIPDELIIPSAFVKTIKKLYDEDRNYLEAILLADRVLQRERYMHSNTVNHIRFIKCQCLARTRNSNFFSEVRSVPEPDRSFLHGFYYRLAGDYVKAEESLTRTLNQKGRRDPRVVGELVLVYMQSDEYDLAFDLSREQYRGRPGNLINANNYFACLIIKEHTEENRAELERIMSRLGFDGSDRAQEILSSARARMLAYYDNDESGSMSLIEESIHRFSKIDYPILTKAELAVHFRNKNKLKEAVDSLETSIGRNAQTYRTFVRFKATLLAMEGNVSQAKALVNKELKGLIGTSLQRLNERLEYIGSK